VRRRATASTSPGRPCRASARLPSPRHPVPRWRRSAPPRHPSSGSEPIGQALGQLALGLVLGSCIGSFVGTLALRAPEDWAALARGRSACPACGTRLNAADLVPLLSYLARGGRCRFCAAPISAYYPAVEVAAAIIGAVCFVLLPPAEALLAAVLGWWLLALALIDLRCFLLPDPLTLPLVPAGLALAASGWPMQAPDLASSSLGALMGFLGLYGLALLYRAVRHREGLGLGDAKLAAAAGAWLGWQPLPTLLLLAALLTLAAALALRAPMRGDTALPLGPGLAAAFFALYLWPAVG
jgi:leader peptidase (prepilin peptidase)/N-methyltransferase